MEEFGREKTCVGLYKESKLAQKSGHDFSHFLEKSWRIIAPGQSLLAGEARPCPDQDQAKDVERGFYAQLKKSRRAAEFTPE